MKRGIAYISLILLFGLFLFAFGLSTQFIKDDKSFGEITGAVVGTGDRCATNSDCELSPGNRGLYCKDRRCRNEESVGHSCTGNRECGSNICLNRKCQPIPLGGVCNAFSGGSLPKGCNSDYATCACPVLEIEGNCPVGVNYVCVLKKGNGEDCSRITPPPGFQGREGETYNEEEEGVEYVDSKCLSNNCANGKCSAGGYSAYCAKDSDCTRGFKCLYEGTDKVGKCRTFISLKNYNAVCAANNDCLSGKCSNRKCAKSPESGLCKKNSDCAAQTICISNRCIRRAGSNLVCTANSQCAEGETCKKTNFGLGVSYCMKNSCVTSNDCNFAPWETYTGALGAFKVELFCNQGQKCDGRLVNVPTNWKCKTNSDCAPNEDCKDDKGQKLCVKRQPLTTTFRTSSFN